MTELVMATPDDAPALMMMAAAFHADQHNTKTAGALHDALMPLLEGSPYGVVYLAGDKEDPVGYALLTFSWSVELGGMDGLITEIYVVPEARGNGIGTGIIRDLSKALSGSLLKALTLKVDHHDEATLRLFHSLDFQVRDHHISMFRPL